MQHIHNNLEKLETPYLCVTLIQFIVRSYVTNHTRVGGEVPVGDYSIT